MHQNAPSNQFESQFMGVLLLFFFHSSPLCFVFEEQHQQHLQI